MRCYSVHFSLTFMLPWMISLDDFLAIDYMIDSSVVEGFFLDVYQVQLSFTVWRISLTYGA